MHIAREGEQEFAAIIRNRSGIDAGNIDYGLRVQLVEQLFEDEKDDICRTVDALRTAIYRCAGRVVGNVPAIVPDHITIAFLDAVEAELGVGAGAWDMVDPKEIIATVLNLSQKLSAIAEPKP